MLWRPTGARTLAVAVLSCSKIASQTKIHGIVIGKIYFKSSEYVYFLQKALVEKELCHYKVSLRNKLPLLLPPPHPKQNKIDKQNGSKNAFSTYFHA